MLTYHQCKSLEKGIRPVHRARGSARPDSAWSRLQSLNSQLLNSLTLNNRALNIQGAGWWPQVEKPWYIFHEAVVFLEERDG